MSDLYRRLSRLTPQQRVSMAAQLKPGNSAPASTRLVAFLVPMDAGSVDIGTIRKKLTDRLPDYMVPSFFISLDELPLTPNGKIDRSMLEKLEHVIPESSLAIAEPSNETEKVLARIWAEVLALDSVGVQDNFFEIGGDSILSIHIVARARQAGLEITPALLFKHPTIAELAAVAGAELQRTNSEQGLVTGIVPLTPIQHWFFENPFEHPDHWNQALLVKTNKTLNDKDLLACVEALIRHHDVLRTRFIRLDGIWIQELTGMPDKLPVEIHDIKGQPTLDQMAHIENTASQLHRSLRLEKANLFQVANFHIEESQDALLLVLHHLITDGVSWRLLLEDLHSSFVQTGRELPIQFPHKTTSIQYWSQQLQNYAGLPKAAVALDYWLANRFRTPQSLPRDFPGDKSKNTEGSSRVVILQLSEKETFSLLEDLPRAYRTQINDVLLTALSQTLSEWLGESSVFVALEGHGRESFASDVNITRTAGWFTSVFPVRIELPPGDIVERLPSVKDQLRSVPENGMSYGLLRYSREYQDSFEGLAEPEIVFNYLGRGDSMLAGLDLFELVSDNIGVARSPENRRRYLIEINCLVRNGCFQSLWSYSYHFHDEQTIKRLAVRFHEALQAIIDKNRSFGSSEYKRADFPLADLSQENLDHIASLLDSLDD